ncbi:ATP-binding protein [Pandoraea sp.]|uniref:sensor histidine kinase n=1 Tax=Pandoraea sp. TaxID=1883445 RepID=UPI001222E230|nr:ATP-binding protein [Pandoraea sp.]TAL56509.1 MAG: sensor histidine kinase [Pandoraea sp.]TAM15330.1 MAG: sensor histidine kinase [Pandoraea sp.]
MIKTWLGRRSWIAAMLLAIAITVGSLLGLEAAHRRMASDYESALQAMTAATELNEVTVRTATIVASQRGYLLTGDDAYLSSYLSAVKRIRALSGTIVAYYTRLHDQQALRDFATLIETFSLHIQAMSDARQAFAQRRMSAGAALARTDRDIDSLEPLQDGFTALYRRELSRARLARERGRTDRWLSAVSAIALSLLNIGLLGLLFRRLGRQLRRERRAREALRAHQARLDNLVQERTQQLDELTTHLQNVSEAEKTKLSRELHDELGAILTACKMDVSWTHRKLRQSDPVLADKLQRALRNLDQGVQIKRRIVEDLRPTVLMNFGLVSALRILAGEAGQQNQWRVTLALPDDDIELDEQTSIVLFRVTQEALTNAAKYAHATEVGVSLVHDAHQVTLEVTDNGVGISPEQIRKPKTHGLLGMRQRVSARGGKIDIRGNAQGAGTTIRITMPRVAAAGHETSGV